MDLPGNKARYTGIHVANADKIYLFVQYEPDQT